MINKFYIVVIIFLLVVMAGMFFSIKSKDNQIAQQLIENFKLNEKLQSIITTTGNKIQIVYRDKDVIHYVNTYIPPENNHTTITTDTNGQVTLKYDKWGFGFYPYIGAAFIDRLYPEIGARLFYFDRYGASLSIIPNRVLLSGDVRIEYGVIKNSAIGLFITNDKMFGISWKTFL